MEKTDTRKLSPEIQYELRKQVVRLRKKGHSNQEISEIVGLYHTHVSTIWQMYQKGGLDALKPRVRGRKHGEQRNLTVEQEATVKKLLVDKTPDQLKLQFALWTRDAVRLAIKQEFGIELPLRTISDYLKRWGFTPQKPLRRAYEQDPRAVERWLNEEYPAIQKQARAERGSIHWGDEMGMRSDHQTGTSYGRRGHTPAIPGTGQRFGCNMISAITNRGHLLFMVFTGRFTAGVMVEFLRRLEKQNDRKVFLIVDRHPVHRSRKVTRWVAEHEDKIALRFLPGYSPQLNPDELLNQDVKSNAVGRQRPKDQPEMMRVVRGYLRSTQGQPEIVQSYFEHESVSYAAQ